jgi:hypothetical protein
VTVLGRKSALDDLTVIVSPAVKRDAYVVSPQVGGKTLVLRKDQTFENAVERLSELFPKEHADDVRRFVRKHMPDAPTFDSILEGTAPAPSWMQKMGDDGEGRPMTRRAKLTTAALVTVIAAASLGGVAAVRSMTESMFDDAAFTSLTRAAHLECRILDSDTAECRNPVKGTVWRVLADEGNDDLPPSYRFLSGQQMAVIYMFPSAEARLNYPNRAAYERVWDYMTARDKIMIGATDAPVLAALAGAVDESFLDGVPQTPATTSRGKPPTITNLLPTPTKSIPTEKPWPTPTGGSPTMLGPAYGGSSPSPEPSSPDTGTPQPPGAVDEPVGSTDPDQPGADPATPAQPATPANPQPSVSDTQKPGIGVQLPGVSITLPLSIGL